MDHPGSTLVAPGVYLVDLPPGGGNVYVWEASHGLTLIDTGVPGSAPAVLAAIEAFGHRPTDVVEILLTHFHTDHTGSAAELASHTGARVLAHRADAAVIAGREPPVPPSLTELERPLARMLFGDVSRLPGPPPPKVEVEPVDDGDMTAGGGTIVATPGHTPGSIALLVRDVLFTGDSIASFEGGPDPGAVQYRPACCRRGRPQAGAARLRYSLCRSRSAADRRRRSEGLAMIRSF
jgi:glyoxylase-like metal-dependent hydrolase (beta-lactamase superfamily II)